MARFDMSGLDEVIAEMEAQGDLIGPAADAMLMAGAEAVKQAWQQAAEQHGHRDTGAMIDSIGYASAPKTIGDAKTIDIFPQGVDGKGVRNVEKAFILHYGTSRRPGSRWVDTADAICEGTVVPAMTAVWESYK